MFGYYFHHFTLGGLFGCFFSYMFIIVLAIIDLAVCLICIPLFVYSELRGLFMDSLCRLAVVFNYGLISASTMMFERYFSICRPHSPLQTKHGKIILSIVCLMTTVKSGISGFNHNATFGVCHYVSEKVYNIYNISAFLLNIFLITSVVVIYTSVYRVVYIRVKS